MLGDVWGPGGFKTSSDLQHDFGLHNTQFYRYLQVRHALFSLLSSLDDLPDSNPLEFTVFLGPLGKGGISRLYKSLVLNSLGSLSTLQACCEGWVGELDGSDWRNACMFPRVAIIPARLHLVQLKFLHVTYLTPLRLFRAGLRPSPQCTRCGATQGHFFHMVWECPPVRSYWSAIFSELLDVTSLVLEVSPRVALLGILVNCGGRRAD